ncbi:hypothetical protein LOTGIDRAFT_215487 [Lottia gigantea]|uniref:Glycogen debranching enzyme n=1 Tax=Lottia gigantea TaxID=225164 RepID=V4ALP1_LOTGI|nr:hypothetical protein LOTGIDRAFT_215487 [Lottia gigantea]ESO94506.1 hypothetical protein LOTGIDRAFT_215487 [Lottia gigantea]
MSKINQVRVLTLNADENTESTLYRLEKGWTLRFVLGASLHAKTVRLFCNHTHDKSVVYERLEFYELAWRNPSGMKNDKIDVFAEVHIISAGSFNYFFTIDGSANGQGYFLVDPTLSFGDDKEDITLDCIQSQTVITKLLGPINEWKDRLLVAKESGYNLIHFTPIQELGISNSAYSIRNQLRLNPLYYEKNKENTFQDVEDIVKMMKKDWQVLSLTDLVYNHTAKDSAWIQKHPDSVYNLDNSPHLIPAYLVDRIFHHFSLQVAEGKWKDQGIPSVVDSEGQLQIMKEVLLSEVFPHFKLHEFYTVSEENILKSFRSKIEENVNVTTNDTEVNIKQDKLYRRLGSTVDMNTVLYFYNTDRPGVANGTDRINQCCITLREKIQQLNQNKINEVNEHIRVAVDNFLANVRWRFLAGDGPKVGQVTEEEPLMWGYFVIPESHEGSVTKEESMIEGEGKKYIFAVNGWVMNDNPLRNFAEEGSLIYLRRELVAWGDSVKLRYGQCPEDSPYLWKHMRRYTEETVQIFHGVRLDNCHSTPIHVAEYMLDAARKIRPDLYVIAELFTGSEALDNLFMNRLGINSLIREALSAWNAHEEGRLVHRYGGVPIGSFVQPRVKPLTPTVAHALFYDQTHDNPSPVEKRSAYDLWPTTALVAMACCATGSNRGYDQLVPHHVHVVTEERHYMSWSDSEKPSNAYINKTCGITEGKRVLNKLHFEMGLSGFSQVYVDQLTDDTVSVTRHNPQTHESIILVCRTSFSHPSNPNCAGQHIKSIHIQGVIKEIILEGSMGVSHHYEYKQDKDYVNGLPDYFLTLRQNIKTEESQICNVHKNPDGTVNISWKNLTPGSVIAFRSCLPPKAKEAILQIRRGLGQFGYLMRSYSGSTMFDDTWDKSNFRVIVSNLDLASLNRVLYRVEAEERDDGYGIGAYSLAGYGSMVYCGLRGIISVLADIRPNNDLGHSLCDNLRQGNWLPDYVANRLKLNTHTHDVSTLGMWFEGIFSYLKEAPRYLIPCYFDALVTGAYVVMREMIIQQMSDFVRDGSTFVQALSMGSVQFCGFVKSSKLPTLSPNLAPPKVRTEIDITSKDEFEASLSLAAGFPHFASGYMRNWGRDTFIAIRGLILLTGRHEEARSLILAYAGTLRHGLIPNLLNEGTGARYNCRDAVWWWLQSIQDYCKHVSNGVNILKDNVSRMYPTDDSEPLKPGEVDQKLSDVIQESLEKHAGGNKYRERNAGSQIDCQMTDKGFDVEYGVDWNTGFVYGGNEYNCGTWMDKMGSSSKAGNKGKPATPRDGSAVEIIGLSMSTVRWLESYNCKNLYPHDGVTAVIKGKEVKITYHEWAEKIKSNFEKYFWVNDTPDPDNEPKPELINRRGIYKDSYLATQFWADYQLRPNFPVAMVVAPELFTPSRAWIALNTVQEVLLGPLGMKTLDPSDWAYKGDYDNANDSDCGRVAGGFNYHQGPEWLWPTGYFLRAKLYFAAKLNKEQDGILKETIGFIESRLANHYLELMRSPWQSLPELTNSNGSYCRDSCRGQAWSIGCLLEVLYDLEKIENHQHLLSTSNSIPDINGNPS